MASSVRDLPPLRTHLEAVTPAGRSHRWGDDEPNPANIPSGARHSSTMPGGHESCDCVLPRKPGTDYSDLGRLTTLRVWGAGGDLAWEGRLERAPTVSGDQMAISPSAVGWQAHLDDDKSATMIYRDTELNVWQGPSRQRRINVLATKSVEDFSIDSDSVLPALALTLQGPWATGDGCEAYYDAHAARIASIHWSRTSNSDQASQPSATFEFFVGTADDDVLTGSQLTSDQHTGVATAETGTFTPTLGQRFGLFIWRFTGANATAGQYTSLVRSVAVYGDHGLTLHGTEPDAGFLASDIVTHAVGRFAPLLNVTATSVQPSSFVIPQLAFLDSTTAGEIVRQATRFGLQDWGVWDDRTFFWYPRGMFGRSWRARISPAQLQETGPQLDRLWNSVIVQYNDVDGSVRTVGPVGSGADTEDAVLTDTDPANPANVLDIIRRQLLTMGTGTAASATEVGRRFLEESKTLDRSGQARLVGHVMDDRGVMHPYWRVRAGDTISFVDAADTSARRIVRADHDRSTRTCAVDLDAPPEGLAALLERLGVALAPLGLN